MTDATSAVALGIVFEQVMRALHGARAPGEIQPLQWSILRYLGRCRLAVATVGATAQFLRLSHAPVSRAIKTMIRKGLLEAVPHPGDNRGAAYVLTEEGRRTAEQDPFLILGPAMAHLAPEERVALQRALRMILLALSDKEAHG